MGEEEGTRYPQADGWSSTLRGEDRVLEAAAEPGVEDHGQVCIAIASQHRLLSFVGTFDGTFCCHPRKSLISLFAWRNVHPPHWVIPLLRGRLTRLLAMTQGLSQVQGLLEPHSAVGYRSSWKQERHCVP